MRIQGIAGIAVELKTERGKVTREQEEILGKMGGNGWACHIIRNMPSFLSLLRTHSLIK
jgi:hypothetical protein